MLCIFMISRIITCPRIFNCTLDILNSINLISGISDVGALDNEEGGAYVNAGMPPPSGPLRDRGRSGNGLNQGITKLFASK